MSKFEVFSFFHPIRLYVCFYFVEVRQQLKAIGTLDANHDILAFSVSPEGVFRSGVWDLMLSSHFEIRWCLSVVEGHNN